MRGIAFRRSQRERARARVISFLNRSGSVDDRMIGIYINTRKPCTCLCCTNQRKFFGKSIGELKADMETAAEIAEIT